MAARALPRREFVALLAATMSAWTGVARAQQGGPRRRIGVLMNLAEEDPEGQARIGAFRRALEKLGWVENRNLLMDYRWGAANAERHRRYAVELVALAPDVLLAGGGQVVGPLRDATSTVPIVFTNTNDPVTLGYVASLARPGGNITGFINIDYGFSVKWLELLKRIKPSVTRAAILWDSSFSSGKTQLEEIVAASPKLQMQLKALDLRDSENLESAVAAFSQEANGGLVVTASTLATLNRKQIISLAARHRLPAVYSNRLYVDSGGLVSYGPDFIDQYRRAADHVDRILKGANPADLPVEAPRKYEMVLNIRTANNLGLNVPRIVRVQVDEVIDR
jgi:putative ABC transport system substrate-binding protein